MNEKSIDSIWETIHRNGSWGAYPSEHIIRFVARNYYNEDRSKIKVLDFGCGQGAHTWYLAREGFDTYAFDGSESAVKKAKSYLETNGLTAHFKVSDGLTVDYPDNYFDAIIDNVCIYANKIKNIRVMYSNIYRFLKPNGKLMTVVFGEEMNGYKSGEEIEEGTFENIKEGNLAHRGVTHIFEQDEITALLKSIGYVDIKCDWIKYTDNGRMVHQYICSAEKTDK